MAKRIVLSLTDEEYLLIKRAFLADSSTDSEAPASFARWCKWRLHAAIQGEHPEN